MDVSDRLFIKVKEFNDEIALKKLMKIVNKWLPNHIYNIIKDRDKTDDIVQEAWITAWVKRSDFNTDYHFNGWIRTIARNIALKSKTEHLITIEDAENGNINYLDTERSTEDNIVESENDAIIIEAMNSLNEKCKELIRLKYFEYLKYKEIASILEMKFDEVRNHLHLCRDNLKNNLKKLGY